MNTPLRITQTNLFIEITFKNRINEYEHRIHELNSQLLSKTDFFSEEKIIREYRRLSTLFNVELTVSSGSVTKTYHMHPIKR